MNEKTTASPQHAPAVALLELVTEHPELRASWRLAEDGLLMGDLRVTHDGRAVMDEFVAVLGGKPTESEYAAPTDSSDRMWSSWLYTTWRDVTLSVSVLCPAESAVPPVGLPSDWSATAVSA